MKDLIPKKGKAVVVMTAKWCKACKPYEERLKDAESAGVKVVRIDVDAHPGVAGAYGVLSVPMSFLVVDGNVVTQFVGPQSSESLIDAFMTVDAMPKYGEAKPADVSETKE